MCLFLTVQVAISSSHLTSVCMYWIWHVLFGSPDRRLLPVFVLVSQHEDLPHTAIFYAAQTM